MRCGQDDGATTGKPVVPYTSLPDQDRFTMALASASGEVVALDRGDVRFDDFSVIDGKRGGGVVGPAASGLVGAGTLATVLELVPHSSTHAGDVPTAFPQTNPLYLLRILGDGAILPGFSLRGTDQGHLYNGLQIYRVVGLRASDIAVAGIPGDAAAPPGETFGINDFKTVGSIWSRVSVDGTGVGASGFGVNGSRDITICDSTSSNSRYAMGFAFWQSSGIRLIDCTADGNAYSGFNFERTTGSNTLIRPAATGNRYDMRIASDQSSARFTIIDPTLVDGRWTVTLPKTFYGQPNKQRRSDITLIVDGKRRPDLLRFVVP